MGEVETKKDSRRSERQISHNLGLRVGRWFYETKQRASGGRASAASKRSRRRRRPEGEDERMSKERFLPRDRRGPFGPYGW